jgi:hypothetical protein
MAVVEGTVERWKIVERWRLTQERQWLERTLREREFHSQQAGNRSGLHFVLGGRKKVEGGIQKGGKRQPKADHKGPEGTPPSVANFGSWSGRRLRRRTAGRIDGTVEARVS